MKVPLDIWIDSHENTLSLMLTCVVFFKNHTKLFPESEKLYMDKPNIAKVGKWIYQENNVCDFFLDKIA